MKSRNKKICIPVTEKVYEQVVRNAKKAGMSCSRYLQEQIGKRPRPIRPDPSSVDAATCALEKCTSLPSELDTPAACMRSIENLRETCRALDAAMSLAPMESSAPADGNVSGTTL